MRKTVLALMFVSITAQAEERFDVSKHFTQTTTITHIGVENVSEACNAERTKRGLPIFQQPSAACSFWKQNSCLIITKKKFTIDDLGHETLHCFAGKFH
jgi:hypothetical protein